MHAQLVELCTSMCALTKPPHWLLRQAKLLSNWKFVGNLYGIMLVAVSIKSVKVHAHCVHWIIWVCEMFLWLVMKQKPHLFINHSEQVEFNCWISPSLSNKAKLTNMQQSKRIVSSCIASTSVDNPKYKYVYISFIHSFNANHNLLLGSIL